MGDWFVIRLARMKLGKDGQISYRSTPEIVAKLDLVAATLAALKLKFDGRKLRTGHVVNAIALWLSSLDPTEAKKFMAPKLKQLESYLGKPRDEPETKPGAAGIRTADLGPVGKPNGQNKPAKKSSKPQR